MKVVPTAIRWHPGMPVFASEQFLKAVGDEYGWIGGTDESNVLRCVLPYTIVRKMGIRLVRFRVETIALADDFGVEEERLFLKDAMKSLRSVGGDIVIPATTNTIFRTYPPGADAAPYGSYVIDLTQEEERIWRNISTTTRQNIKTAKRDGTRICSGIEYLRVSYQLIRDTLERSNLEFMTFDALERFVVGLGENGKIMVAEYNGVVQSCAIYAFSKYCAYYVFAGNIAGQHQGAGKLIHWEAIRFFQSLGVERYDFVGTRIDPEKGSKQQALSLFKKRFGGRLKVGFLWKYNLRPARSLMYTVGIRFLRGGDIVDHERHKLKRTVTSDSALCEH